MRSATRSARNTAAATPLLAALVVGVGSAWPEAQAQLTAPLPAPAPALPAPALPASPPVPGPAVAPPIAVDPAEVAKLQQLAARLQAERSELDRQRQALRDERTALSAVDQPARAEQIAQWTDRHATGTRIGQRVASLDRLLAALTPQTLQAISPPGARGYEFRTDVGLKATTLEVALRDAPDGVPTIALPAGTLVVQVAADADGQWSVVVAADGFGFVPASQLAAAN